MAYENPVDAKIVAVVEGYGTRIYRLKFAEPVGKTAYVRLSFGEYPQERQFFFNVANDDTVLCNAHRCPDLFDMLDVFYVWQRKMQRMTAACPRCHRRLDVVPMRRNSK
jgi:hypothetical protein